MAATQYHMNFSHEEDRLYIFVRDDEGAEHAFAITRRLFKRLWPALGQAIQETSEAAKKAAPPMKSEVLQIEREGAVTEAKESGAVTTGALPKVEKRVTYLVQTVHIRTGKAGNKVLVLTDGQQTMNIGLTHERLIVFCDALKSLVARSDWDLDLAYPWESETESKGAAQAATPKPPTRH